MNPQPAAPELTGIARLPLAIVRVSPRLGLDPAELMRDASIDTLDLRDPDARVPLAKILRLWRAVAERQPDPAVGLRLGSAMTVRDLGLVGYAMAHSSSLGEALRRFSRYCRILSGTLSTLRRFSVWRRWRNIVLRTQSSSNFFTMLIESLSTCLRP